MNIFGRLPMTPVIRAKIEMTNGMRKQIIPNVGRYSTQPLRADKDTRGKQKVVMVYFETDVNLLVTHIQMRIYCCSRCDCLVVRY